MVVFILQNSLSLNDALGRNCVNGSEFRGDLDLTNLQNLQAIHALKYLQQPPGFFNSVLQNACSSNASQV